MHKLRIVAFIIATLLVACDTPEAETPVDVGDVTADVLFDATPAPMTLRVMTFNVLCSFCGGDEYDPWSARLAYFEDLPA